MGLFTLDDDDKMHNDNVKLQRDDVIMHWYCTHLHDDVVKYEWKSNLLSQI